MAIITISRGCFSHGTEIAKRVTEMLGYKLVSREMIISEASKHYNISEKELLKSIHDGPTILERVTHGREKYLSYLQAVLMRYAMDDNLVYHGNAGHFLLPEIDHLLKIRIIADMEDRILFTQKLENLSRQEAIDYIQKDDKHRARWTSYLYNVDIKDPSIYDIVLNIGRLSFDDACNIIAYTAKSDSCKTSKKSKNAVFDLAISSQVKAAIQNLSEAVTEVKVTSNNGLVNIKAQMSSIRKSGYVNPETEKKMSEKMQHDLIEEISRSVGEIPGIKDIIYDIETPHFS
ncbi:MAG: cytidylate kinase-like family protein [Deltaproteobacteria bacterium]|nr:cytidylate kinase-like family protein [Deltaproteobacteria bacterium]